MEKLFWYGLNAIIKACIDCIVMEFSELRKPRVHSWTRVKGWKNVSGSLQTPSTQSFAEWSKAPRSWRKFWAVTLAWERAGHQLRMCAAKTGKKYIYISNWCEAVIRFFVQLDAILLKKNTRMSWVLHEGKKWSRPSFSPFRALFPPGGANNG